MSEFAPQQPEAPTRIPPAEYLRLIETGVLGRDDRVELLGGVIVAMTPSDPSHATATMRATFALARAVGSRAAIRTQSRSSRRLVRPSPMSRWCRHSTTSTHPESALVVEVSNTSLKQDRLSKSRIYAAANIPEYWIVNLRESVVEVMRDPDPATALYRDTRICTAGDALELAALPGARVALAELLPTRS
jgi:Uma2 family endonuclease